MLKSPKKTVMIKIGLIIGIYITYINIYTYLHIQYYENSNCFVDTCMYSTTVFDIFIIGTIWENYEYI